MAVPGPQVYEKERPGYDAKGINASGVTILPSISLSETYDSNIFAADSNEKDDFITVVRPRVDAETQRGPLTLNGSAEGAFSFFSENDSQDVEEFDLRADGSYAVTPRDTVSLGAAYVRDAIARSDVEDGGGSGKPRLVHRAIGTAGYDGEHGPYVFSVDLGARNLNFIRSEQRDRDRNEYNASGRVGYKVTPLWTPFVEANYHDYDFDLARDDNGFNRDATRIGGNVGAVFEIPDRWFVEGWVGLAEWSFDDNAFDDETIWTAGLDAGWNPTPLTTLKASLLRDLENTSRAGDSLKEVIRATVGAEYAFRPNILGFAEAGYRYVDFQEGDRQDDNYGLTVGGDYLINAMFSLQARYTLSTRESNIDGEDFTRNEVTLGVTAQF